ncbi:helix-turn-helix domain-containing protein [Rhodopseudomonas palustris]|uniref:helix-turn-helix domain-containing protein n=1 Tax=Rhodopseudomonas palustris TaxID=1076 RepID=UPI000D1A29F2|nr:AraC family transcriptional regulator [Rhodopseudomonas palustris]AVT80237.1 AraC family transcriptional regulator [Rhodopseudomonas palustris]
MLDPAGARVQIAKGRRDAADEPEDEDQMTRLEAFGDRKFPAAELILSSEGRSWDGIGTQVRRHPAGEIPVPVPDQMEVTLAIAGSQTGRVERRSGSAFQNTTARPGTLWFCPIGVTEDSIRITETLPMVQHVFLAKSQFDSLSELSSRSLSPASIAYLADVSDELVRQICQRIYREAQEETSSGKILIDCLAQSLVAHLVSDYSHDSRIHLGPDSGPSKLDDARLRRVLDYIYDNIDQDLSLSKLSEVACLSKHHFARAFREATGTPPYRFISERRLDHALNLLKDSRLSLAEIAYICRFSSQATFTRAFRRHVGTSPGEYRHLSRT